MADIPDRISQTFQECDACGGYFVRVASHECPTGGADGTDPTREERMRRASEDTRPATDRVALLPARTIDGSYAYHDIGEDGLPVCGGGGGRDDEQWIHLSREDAKARGKAPCGTCARLTRESDGSVAGGPGSAPRFER